MVNGLSFKKRVEKFWKTEKVVWWLGTIGLGGIKGTKDVDVTELGKVLIGSDKEYWTKFLNIREEDKV